MFLVILAILVILIVMLDTTRNLFKGKCPKCGRKTKRLQWDADVQQYPNYCEHCKEKFITL